MVRGVRLHARPMGESHHLCCFITSENGRVYTRISGEPPEPFRECELKLTLRDNGYAPASFRYIGAPLFEAQDADLTILYLHELLYRLAPLDAPSEALYGCYQATLLQWAENRDPLLIRFFEYQLLVALGQQPDFFHDSTGAPLAEKALYRYLPHQGFVLHPSEGFLGARVVAAGKWQGETEGVPSLLRQVLSAELDQLLEDKVLNSRLWRQMRSKK